MKKSILLIVTILTLSLVFAAPLCAAEKDWTGFTPISTADDLAKIADDLNGNYYLTNDITFAEGQVHTPIGSEEFPFNGTFDGNGFAIRNLVFSDNDLQVLGLFGDNHGMIRNLTLCGAYSSAEERFVLGGICGVNRGTVLNCVNEMSITSSGCIGGIVGTNCGTVLNCTNKGALKGMGEHTFVGGICGASADWIFGHGLGNVYHYASTVDRCANYADISSEHGAGGIVGESYSSYPEYKKPQQISYSFNHGDVTAHVIVGGIIGVMEHAFLKECYSSDEILTDPEHPDCVRGGVAGSVGLNSSGNGFHNCVYYTNVKDTVSGYGSHPHGVGYNGILSIASWSDPKNDFAFQDYNYETVWNATTVDFCYPELKPISLDDPQRILLDSHHLLFVGEEKWMSVSIDPVSCAASLVWENSDPDVALVSGSGKITALAPGTTELTLRSADGSVSATCNVTVLKTPESVSFTDVRENDWFWPYVDFAAKYRLYYGMDEQHFAPNNSMTRGMVVTVLHRIEGTPTLSKGPGFADMKEPTWYTDAVVWAAENGIAFGYEDGTFRPEEEVTREQFVSFLQRYAKWKGFAADSPGNLDYFEDDEKVGSWAKSSVEWAVGEGIINGKPGGNATYYIDPQGITSRAEVAKMLSCFLTDYFDFARVESISFERDQVRVPVYQSVFLPLEIYPFGALKAVKWNVEDAYPRDCLSVSFGTVRAELMGEGYVTAEANGVKAKCAVNIVTGDSKFAQSFSKVKDFLIQNGGYDNESNSYGYGYTDETFAYYLEYLYRDNLICFVYEEIIEGENFVRATMVIDEKQSPYQLECYFYLEGEDVYAGSTIHAVTFTASTPVLVEGYHGDKYYREYVEDNMQTCALATLHGAELIFEEVFTDVSIRDFGFTSLLK